MARQMQIIRGGQVVDIANRHVGPADILIEGDTIREVGPPGLAAPDDAQAITASDRLIMPGLVNAHTHGHGSLGKGLGDKWSLELLLNASPWTSGGFTLEDKRLAAQLNAAEMVLKGCTAAYDMYFEFPTATVDGIEAILQGYRDLGLRVTLAPMMADITLFRAIPGLLEALPEPLRDRAAAMSAAPFEEHITACRKIVQSPAFDGDTAWPALGPTIPLHCTDSFLTACRDLAAEHGVAAPVFSKAVRSQLAQYSWPGNVRQLIKVLKRTVYLDISAREALSAERRYLNRSAGQEEYRDSLWPDQSEDIRSIDWVKSQYAARALEVNDNNKSDTANRLDISPNTLKSYISEAER